MKCNIMGVGPSTVFASLPGQDKPVIDFTGYICRPSFQDIIPFCNFAVEGDGTEGSHKEGIRLGTVGQYNWGVQGISFSNLSVKNTGGCPLYLGGSMCCNFDKITLNNPVEAAKNNVPYIHGEGAFNGNYLSRIALRSITTKGDVAVNGAAQFNGVPGVAWCPANNTFDSWWYEYQHLQSNSALFSIEGNYNIIRDFEFFDIGLLPGTVNTAQYRILLPPAGRENYGSNHISGYIGGGANGFAQAGVEVYQRANSIEGTKGKGGRNVVLMDQARYTTVIFRDSEQEPDPSSHGVVNKDGKETYLDGSCTIFDIPNGYYYMGGGINGPTIDFGGGVVLNREVLKNLMARPIPQPPKDSLEVTGIPIEWRGSGKLYSEGGNLTWNPTNGRTTVLARGR